MSDSYISVDEGTERKIDHWQRTINSATVDQGRVVLAPTFVPTYVATHATAIAISTANDHIMQLMASADFRYLLRRIEVEQVAAANATAQVEIALYRLSSAGTGGTAVSPVELDPVNDASTAAGMTLPSSKGTEGDLLGIWTAVIQSTITNQTAPLLDIKFDGIHLQPPTVAAGTSNGLALKCLDSDSTATVRTRLTFEELDWS